MSATRASRARAMQAITSLLLSCFALVKPAGAQFLTTRDAIADGTVITFSNFLANTTLIGDAAALTGDGGVTIRNTSPADRPQPAIYNSSFNLGGFFPSEPLFNDPELCTNGRWTATRAGFVGLAPRSAVRVEFGGRAIRGVGALMNYAPLCGTFDQSPPLLRLLNANGGVLESFNIDALARITTPNQENAGLFRGALRTQGDAYAVEFVGGFLVLDDLTFTLAEAPPTTVPEPGTLGLLAVGLAAVAVRRRHRAS